MQGSQVSSQFNPEMITKELDNMKFSPIKLNGLEGVKATMSRVMNGKKESIDQYIFGKNNKLFIVMSVGNSKVNGQQVFRSLHLR